MITRLAAMNVRRGCLLGLSMCVLMMGVALVLQYVYGLTPCPLCIGQRIAVLLAALVFAVGAVHNPAGRVGRGVYASLGALAAAMGVAVAARHVWLQSLPAESVPSCGPGLDYMMEVLPLWSVVSRVLSGSGECAEIHGLLLGMSIPQWTLVGFAVLLLIPLGMLAGIVIRRR
ncbi:disulfide bond formation protein B [Chromohalobacter japonicus]|uniref:disulfide bond formation protein B n=1 Tax=Chromohalobacter japonicus TaxID=223900 RepID=UPI001FF5EA28|nr:disulfide bond formation protein B [Chromohalobacter japonicus]MCK0751759.1 disulfide bond formation protein B [Chromohalobacter japonicus]